MAQNYRAMNTAELLPELEFAGLAPELELIRACMDRRMDLTPGLLDMLAAPGDKTWENDDPRWYAPVHAGHLLIYYREPQAIPIFMRLLRDPENENLVEWFQDAIASYGMALLEPAREILNDPTTPENARMGVPAMLKELAAEFPTERAQVIGILRDALPPVDENGKLVVPRPLSDKPDVVWTMIATTLAELHDFHSRPQIQALYHDGWMDETVMGEEQQYLELLMHPEPLSPQPFNIIETYQDLRASAESKAEWQAKAQEIRAQQERIKQAAAPKPIAGAPPAVSKPTTLPEMPALTTNAETISRALPKVGRNDPCPCGSGRKYKQCHGK